MLSALLVVPHTSPLLTSPSCDQPTEAARERTTAAASQKMVHNESMMRGKVPRACGKGGQPVADSGALQWSDTAAGREGRRVDHGGRGTLAAGYCSAGYLSRCAGGCGVLLAGANLGHPPLVHKGEGEGHNGGRHTAEELQGRQAGAPGLLLCSVLGLLGAAAMNTFAVSRPAARRVLTGSVNGGAAQLRNALCGTGPQPPHVAQCMPSIPSHPTPPHPPVLP